VALLLPGAHPLAWLALACASLLALPGVTEGRGLLDLPSGGDEGEPSAAVRTISSLAHHGWLGAWAAFSACAIRPHADARTLILAGLLALLAFLMLRALVAGLARERAGAWLLGLGWGLALLDLAVTR
jgi:hypothetical protein